MTCIATNVFGLELCWDTIYEFSSLYLDTFSQRVFRYNQLYTSKTNILSRSEIGCYHVKVSIAQFFENMDYFEQKTMGRRCGQKSEIH